MAEPKKQKKNRGKPCVLCDEGTANELVVHETCHDESLTEHTSACVECERPFTEVGIDPVLHELQLKWLPNYRAAVS